MVGREPLLEKAPIALGRIQAGRSEKSLLFGAGLPQLVGLAGKAKSYAERLFLFPNVGPLPAGEAKEALQIPVQSQGVEFTLLALDVVASTSL